jgi:hypothetical protein
MPDGCDPPENGHGYHRRDRAVIEPAVDLAVIGSDFEGRGGKRDQSTPLFAISLAMYIP